ncbi:hypothetical protein [Knoellia subterranea]|uniref:Uncharacterized protein n=1 Tax=Knoellia subterranea KCTC 19937 TaxID=1385521 RepID=A0A0A0JJA2_9MICO|nr:hypothetical protein [Knoellia subterranea]KGN36122.1 hypothetical protein N803_09490 [Knoellia subterranea KCTC 19937]
MRIADHAVTADGTTPVVAARGATVVRAAEATAPGGAMVALVGVTPAAAGPAVATGRSATAMTVGGGAARVVMAHPAAATAPSVKAATVARAVATAVTAGCVAREATDATRGIDAQVEAPGARTAVVPIAIGSSVAVHVWRRRRRDCPNPGSRTE